MGRLFKPLIMQSREEIWVPHRFNYILGEIAFDYPSLGKGTYGEVETRILKSGKEVPNGDYLASFLYEMYSKKWANEFEPRDIKGIMRDEGLWVFNQNLWTPFGVYVVLGTETNFIGSPLNISELESRLIGGIDVSGVRFSPDRLVRFAPKGSYQNGKLSPKEFEMDGFVIASFGEEGAQKLGEVASKFSVSPHSFILDLQKGQEQRVSSIKDYCISSIFDLSSLVLYGNSSKNFRHDSFSISKKFF